MGYAPEEGKRKKERDQRAEAGGRAECSVFSFQYSDTRGQRSEQREVGREKPLLLISDLCLLLA